MNARFTLLTAALLLGCNPSGPQEPAAHATAPTAETKAPPTPETPVPQLPDFDAFWNYGDPTGTETAFRDLLADHPDAPLPWRLELLTQIARTHSLRDQFAQAHEMLDAIDNASKHDGEDLARVRVRADLERGRSWNSAGDKARARPLFERAWKTARSTGEDGLAVDAAHMVAIAAMGTEDELAWGLKALELARSSEQEAARKWRGSLYNNIGWTFHEKGDFPKALELWEQQIAARREDGKEPALRVALWTHARGLRSLKRHDEALAELDALVESYGEDAAKDGFVHEERAENLLALGRVEEARVAFGEAHQRLKDSWLKKHEPERLARLAEMATR